MLLQVLSILTEYHGDEFIEKVNQMETRKKSPIDFNAEKMIFPIRIPGTELWVEGNQSSKSVLSLITQVLKVCDDKEDDFEAYW